LSWLKSKTLATLLEILGSASPEAMQSNRQPFMTRSQTYLNLSNRSMTAMRYISLCQRHSTPSSISSRHWQWNERSLGSQAFTIQCSITFDRNYSHFWKWNLGTIQLPDWIGMKWSAFFFF
jgi:hypothetical protein